MFVKYRIVDRRIACDVWGGVVLECWNNTAPGLGIARKANGSDLWENFGFLASLCQQWLDAHPNGAYPKDAKHLPTPLPSASVAALAHSVVRPPAATAVAIGNDDAGIAATSS